LLSALYVDVQQFQFARIQAAQVRFQHFLANRDMDRHHAEDRAFANRAFSIIVGLRHANVQDTNAAERVY